VATYKLTIGLSLFATYRATYAGNADYVGSDGSASL
jgi:hypothetical protein